MNDNNDTLDQEKGVGKLVPQLPAFSTNTYERYFKRQIHASLEGEVFKPFQVTLEEAMEKNLDRYGIFWTAQSLESGKRRITENVKEIICWAVDIDGPPKGPPKEEQWRRIQTSPLPPSLVVESKNGYHVYWHAIDATRERFEEIEKDRLLPFFSADIKATLLVQFLRVPGFFHWKDANDPFLCQVVLESNATYTEAEMLQAFPLTEKKFNERVLSLSSNKKSGISKPVWKEIFKIDCEQALKQLSGTDAVKGEVYSFKPTRTGTLNILVDEGGGKSGTSCWIDQRKTIGSMDGGGPSIWHWLMWHWKDAKKVKELILSLFPEVFENAKKNGRADDHELVERITQALPHRDEKGRVLNTIPNFSTLLHELGVIVRYNVITKEEEILILDEEFAIDNRANASLAWIVSWCARIGLPRGNIEDYLSFVASQNLYNPVTTWILSKKWDGSSRLEELYATLVVKGEHEELKKILIRKWLISAIAAAFNPNGVSAHGVLVLQGDQYMGKTQWFKRLAPADLGVIAEGKTLRPDDRDSIKQIVCNWLVELGELDSTFRKADIEQLKAFLTKDRDVFRRAFARRESEYARRTVFFGSVNPQQFLHDPTGNRRFWTIACERIQHDHTLDMQQLWAEVYHSLYLTKASWFLTQAELLLLNEHNETFTAIDPIEERVSTHLNWKQPSSRWRWKTATQVLIELMIDRPTQSEVRKASQLLYKLNGKQRKKYDGSMVLLVPENEDENKYQPGPLSPQFRGDVGF